MAKPSTPGTAKVKRPRKPGVTVTLLDISLSGVAPVVGQSTSWSVTARYSNNTFKDITAASVLSSNNTTVANWTAQGILSAFTTGSVIITAVYQGQTTTQSLVIQSAPPTPPPPAPVTLLSLTLTALGSVPSIGGLQNYSVSGHFSDNTDKDLTSLVAYSSSNHAVAAWVTQGTLQAISGGTSILTVSYQGITSSPTTINIATPPPPPPPVVLTQLRLNPPAQPNPAIGGTVKYTVTGIMSNGDLVDYTLLVTYHTGNAGIAFWTNPLGTLQGVAAGTCNIYVDTTVTINTVLTTITSPILTTTVPTNPTPPPPSVGGSTYYVSTTGNDSVTAQQATNPATPKRTFRNAVQLLKPGDQLLGRGGNYDEGLTNVPSGTSWSNKVRIANYPGEPVWLAPLAATASRVIFFDALIRYVEFDGINMDGSQQVFGTIIFGTADPTNPMPDHLRVMNAEVKSAPFGTTYAPGGAATIEAGNHIIKPNSGVGGHEFINLKVHGGGKAGGCGIGCFNYGIYLASPNCLVDKCNIYDNCGGGVQIYNGGGDNAANCIVRNSIIHDISHTGDNRNWGILISGNNALVYNNIIYNLTVPYAGNSGGISAYSAANPQIYNNTIYNNIADGIALIAANVTNAIVKNNISYLNTGGVNYLNAGTGTVQDHNLFGVNPLFVNPTVFDFRIQAGSPARNAGATIPLVTTDIAGTPRPKGAAYDIGAYEYIE